MWEESIMDIQASLHYYPDIQSQVTMVSSQSATARRVFPLSPVKTMTKKHGKKRSQPPYLNNQIHSLQNLFLKRLTPSPLLRGEGIILAATACASSLEIGASDSARQSTPSSN